MARRHHCGSVLRPMAGFVSVLVSLLAVAACTAGSSTAITSRPEFSVGAPPPDRGALDVPLQALGPRAASALDWTLQDLVATGRVPRGVTAAVITDQGAWSGAAGIDGAGASLTPDAELAIGSITKNFVAAEVLLLAGAGHVDLEAPLSRYVDEPVADNGATVRQALAMQSGIPTQYSSEYLAAVIAQPERHWTPQETLSWVPERRTTPGSEVMYSNANYILLGLLIEQVTGRSLAAALRRDLLAPLGLDRVLVQDEERPPAPLAAPGVAAERVAPDGYLPMRSLVSAAYGAGCMAADAPSLARWGYLLFSGRLLPADVVSQMTTFAGRPGKLQYGLGTMRFGFGGLEAVGHVGEMVGYTAGLFFVPGRQMAIAVLVPGTLRRMEEVGQRLMMAVPDPVR